MEIRSTDRGYNGEFGRSGDVFWILDEIKKEKKRLYGFTQSNCAELHERVISVYLSYAFVGWRFSLKSEGCHNVWWRTLLEPWEQAIPTPNFCLTTLPVFLFLKLFSEIVAQYEWFFSLSVPYNSSIKHKLVF